MLREFCCGGCAALLIGVLPVGAQGAEPANPFPETALGETLFSHNWAIAGDWEGPGELGDGGDGLGPLFNDVSCAACHHLSGPGGAGGNDKNAELLSVESDAPVPRNARAAFLRRLRRVHPGFDDSATVVLQKYGLGSRSDPLQYDLWRQDLLGHVALGYSINSVIPVSLEIGPDRFELAQRNTPALWGAGLIDHVSSHGGSLARAEQARLQAERTPWITGRIPRTAGGQEGWFGWRGQTESLHDFVLNACAHELGLEVPGHVQPSSPLVNERDQKRDRASVKLDLTDEQCRALTGFVRQLPRPDQHLPYEGTPLAIVRAGELLFEQVGCTDCHVKQLATLDGVYSDFLLHDMGTDLTDRASALPEIRRDERVTNVRGGGGYSGGSFLRETELVTLPCDCEFEWRTPPLWGVADSAPYMHDGRAANLLEAIRCHDGEAAPSRHDFLALSAEERNQVLAFLESLRAPDAGELAEADF